MRRRGFVGGIIRQRGFVGGVISNNSSGSSASVSKMSSISSSTLASSTSGLCERTTFISSSKRSSSVLSDSMGFSAFCLKMLLRYSSAV